MSPRETPKRPLVRIFLGLLAAIGGSCLATASDDATRLRACADLGSPSNFDYLVLASIADSRRLLSMAVYRSPLPPAKAKEIAQCHL
jgi:hypothetical protein